MWLGRWVVSASDWVTAVLAGLSLVVAVVAAVISGLAVSKAKEANGIAEAARQDALEARIGEAWAQLLSALDQLALLDPTRDDTVRPVTRARTAMTVLVDALPHDQWGGSFDGWLSSELRLGISLLTERHERLSIARSGDDHVAAFEPASAWTANFVSNLRRFRRDGWSAAEGAALTRRAVKSVESLFARNNWGEVPGPPTGVVPLHEPEQA